MRDTRIYHCKNCIMAFFHVIEDGLGNIDKLNHDSFFVLANEPGQFDLEVGLEFSPVSPFGKVEHLIIELVRLELLHYLPDAILLIVSNLVFKSFNLSFN